MTEESLPDAAPDGGRGGVTWRELQSYFPNSRISTYLKPLPSHDLLYVKNPKAACSTLLLWLDRIHTGEKNFRPTNIHQEHRLPSIRQVGRRRVLSMIRGTAFRFTFVRHPLRRLESVYWDKVADNPRWRTRMQAMLDVPQDPAEQISFEQFLSAVELQPVIDMDPHWRPQHVNLLHPLVAYDRVGRVESFDADLQRIRDEAGLPALPWERRNSSRHQTPESVYANRPDLVRRAERIYEKDFELYGY
ncbi:sulfotransferase family protein [Nocardioides coralli]|uniref:sulfotransferase family protein n=1 Tax=Nocardioides coralli TaxID=2872154 RepID=UPI001CA40C07|nr:sulfotransferase family protein [Nocardioides coralli]QZY28147.1 sulfotransferase family protein [Nocardioides coralli]